MKRQLKHKIPAKISSSNKFSRIISYDVRVKEIEASRPLPEPKGYKEVKESLKPL